MIENLFFDSDLLGDDFFALYGIIRNPEMRLLGITTFGRRVTAIERARMAQVFLSMHGAEGIDIVPGADRPIMQEVRKSCTFCDDQMQWLRTNWEEGKEYGCDLLDENASSYLIRRSKELGHISLLCTGPLTNIALAIAMDSSFPSRIDSLYFMGGVHSIQGNSSPVSESNVRNDPEAASIVFRNVKGIHVIPYDITMQVVLSREEVLSIGDDFFRDTALSCCRSHECRAGGSSIMPMHDYLAYLAMSSPSIVGYRRCSADIECSFSPCRGMMILRDSDTAETFYGCSVDAAAAHECLVRDFGVSI